MRITLEAFGDVQLDRELLRWSQAADDMRPAFDRVHDLFIDTETRQFQSQGRYASGGWAPLAPSTVAAKKRKRAGYLRRGGSTSFGGDPRILHDTLRLRKSFTNKMHEDHVYRASADEMFVGSKVEYAQYHQHGTSRMPQRRPFELTETLKKSIMRILQRHLAEGPGLR